jgi:dCTP deaminase
MLITHTELKEELSRGLLTVPSKNPHPYNKIDESQVNGASIDVRLGRTFLRETPPGVTTLRPSYYVCLKGKEELTMGKEILPWGNPFYLAPGEFILAQTVEVFNLPNDIAAEFRLKSSVARAALDQALAVWIDPGFHNSVLTIELKNNARYHTLVLEAGMKIGQIVFFRGVPVPDAASYAVRGQYNNLSEVTGSKGVK